MGSQPGAGQALQSGRRLLRLAIYSVLEASPGLVFGAAEPLLDNVSFALFVMPVSVTSSVPGRQQITAKKRSLFQSSHFCAVG